MLETISQSSEFSGYEIVSAMQFVQAYETELVGKPGTFKAEFEDFCAVELGLPTREQARALMDTAKAELNREQVIKGE